jgi:hypothetical protein
MKTLVICLLSVSLFRTDLYSQFVQQEWSARYNGSGNDVDVANDIAVDASGNAYVTGGSHGSDGEEIVTIKYDTDGNQVWLARFSEKGGMGWGQALVLDASGNVYVTGTYGYHYITIKYDSTGSEVWVARYVGPGNSRDDAFDIVLDAAGDVYVTGNSEGSGTNTDCATIKYDGDTGDEIRVVRYNGPANGGDEARAIILDEDNNIYITGYSYIGSKSTWDYITIKYDSLGREEWVAHYNGDDTYGDFASDIALDSRKNVYVTGREKGYGYIGVAYATIKYDTYGNELWVARYTGSFSEATALAVDKWDNIYVTGTNDGGQSDRDYLTIKYDTNGEELWVARYMGTGNRDDSAADLILDNHGNVYVTGTSYEGEETEGNYVTVKYDTDGNQQWIARYDGTGNNSDYAGSIAIDEIGNIYVTGASPGGEKTHIDYATVKYTPILYLSVDPDTTEYHPGDVLNFTTTLSSNSDTTFSFQGWSEVETPLGTNLSPWIDPIDLSLKTQQVLSRYISQQIPYNAPSSRTYVYRVKAGTYPDLVIAEDQFEINILPRE